MKTRSIAVARVIASIFAIAAAAQAPQAEISDGKMTAKLYLPDAQHGFYRGARFDWAGTIFDLEVAGHHLYRPWFTSVDPAVTDFTYSGDAIVAGTDSAMTGPAEEFQKPLGYEEAKPGETFLKLGVGLLRKLDDKPYSFRTHFELVDGGVWKTTRTAHSITFQQTFSASGSKYGYIYTKTIRLIGNKNEMVIEHRLQNTGKLPLQTTVYDHNFFTIDGQTVGAGFSVAVPYAIHPDRQPDAAFVRIAGDKAEYIAGLKAQDRVMFGLQGFSTSAKDYQFDLYDRAAGFAVHIAGDRPLVNAVVWSIRSVIAVEPFIAVSAEPGQEFRWAYTYTYTDRSE